MKKLFCALACFFCLGNIIGQGSAVAQTWTVFMNIESDQELNDMAIKNITDATLAIPRNHVTIVIQLHAFGTTAYRYIIKQNALIPLHVITLTSSHLQNFIDSAQWAFETYPSDNTMLIAWNHGFGALEPQWNATTNHWESEPDLYSAANHLEPDEMLDGMYAPCPLRSLSWTDLHEHHKGYMFNSASRQYLTNNDLVTAFESICRNVKKHKLDIIGFDTCMGCMLENGYQLIPYADYLVGVQSCASKDGWNYKAFGQVFDNPEKSPRNVAAALVKTFDDYYQSTKSTDIYTLTALDLTRVTIIKDLLDQSAQLIFSCAKSYGTHTLRQAFRIAHSKCYKLCLFPMYTDMYTLLALFNQQLALITPSAQLTTLRNTLDKTCTAITDALVAHCYGSALTGMAHGISIYCPDYHVDSSYANIRFGKESQWSNILAWAMGEVTAE